MSSHNEQTPQHRMGLSRTSWVAIAVGVAVVAVAVLLIVLFASGGGSSTGY